MPELRYEGRTFTKFIAAPDKEYPCTNCSATIKGGETYWFQRGEPPTRLCNDCGASIVAVNALATS